MFSGYEFVLLIWISLSCHPSLLFVCVVTNHGMNHHNQSHPVQLVAKFTAFPAINPPTYSSRLVSASPATASIVGKRRLLQSLVFWGVSLFNILKFGGKTFLIISKIDAP